MTAVLGGGGSSDSIPRFDTDIGEIPWAITKSAALPTMSLGPPAVMKPLRSPVAVAKGTLYLDSKVEAPVVIPG
jgi:hypothetical protein